MLILYYLHPNTIVCTIPVQVRNKFMYIPKSHYLCFEKGCLHTHLNVHNTFSATNLFQIPIVVVSPDPEPVTRSQRMTMIDSGHELKLHHNDFKKPPNAVISNSYSMEWSQSLCSNLCYVTYPAQPMETEGANHLIRGLLAGCM